MSRFRTFGAALGIVVLVAGCRSGSAEITNPTPRPSTATELPNVLVMEDAPRFPPQCRPLTVAQLVLDFFEAINAGESSRAKDYFSKDNFQWYSVTEGNPRESGRHRSVRVRGDLAGYFRQRFIAQERLELVSLRIGFDPDRQLGHMSLVIRRTAADLAALGISGNIATGKAAVDCDDGTIMVWSIGMKNSGKTRQTNLCSNRPSANPNELPVACAEV